MKDLVERLRGNFPKKEDCKEAADEIVRLRVLLEEAKIPSKKKVEKEATLSVGNRLYIALSAYAENTDMTQDEMGEYSGLDQTNKGWWATISVLKKEGYLVATNKKRLGRAGVLQGVCKITPKGINVLESLGYGK
jgi:hypothetical protein